MPRFIDEIEPGGSSGRRGAAAGAAAAATADGSGKPKPLGAPPPAVVLVTHEGGAIEHAPDDAWQAIDLSPPPLGWRPPPLEPAVKPAPAPRRRPLTRNERHWLMAGFVLAVVALALTLGLALGLKGGGKHYTAGPDSVPPGPARVASGFVPPGAAVSPVPVDDAAQRKALLAAKAALDPDGAVLADWSSPAAGAAAPFAYCAWPYVTCDKAGRVVEALNFTADGGGDGGGGGVGRLSGALPAGAALAAGLPGLRVFDARAAALRGPLPADWSKLQRLQVVRLDQNALTGEVPAAWGLALADLEVLTLWSNRLAGGVPDALGRLRKLRELDLAFNRLEGGVPASLGRLGQLTAMRLDGNRGLSGTLPPEWGSLGNLEKLYLAENAFEGRLPAAWAGMRSLAQLLAESNALSGPLPPSWGLGGMTKLERLTLNDNDLDGPIPPEWRGMAALRTVALYNNEGLAGCAPAGWKAQLDVADGFEASEFLMQGTRLTGFC